MILSYLALALVIVLFLAGIAGTAFTFHSIVQRQMRGDSNSRTWHGIFTPLPAFQFDYLRLDSERAEAGSARLFYRVAYYLALSIATIEHMAAALFQTSKQ